MPHLDHYLIHPALYACWAKKLDRSRDAPAVRLHHGQSSVDTPSGHVTPMRLSKSDRRILPSSNLVWTAPPPPKTSYEDAWLAGASQIHKQGAAATSSQSSKAASNDFDDVLDHNDADQEMNITFDTSVSILKDSVTRNLPIHQPQETTVMHMSIPDSEATTIDNSHSLSGIKISSLINSFDNAWGADPSNKTQSMLQADSSSDDDECYMEEDHASLDQSADYSLDSDINASQPAR
jgi:hypothetical protein